MPRAAINLGLSLLSKAHHPPPIYILLESEKSTKRDSENHLARVKVTRVWGSAQLTGDLARTYI